MNALKASDFIKNVFGKEFVEVYANLKEIELMWYKEAEKNQNIGEWELKQYLDI